MTAVLKSPKHKTFCHCIMHCIYHSIFPFTKFTKNVSSDLFKCAQWLVSLSDQTASILFFKGTRKYASKMKSIQGRAAWFGASGQWKTSGSASYLYWASSTWQWRHCYNNKFQKIVISHKKFLSVVEMSLRCNFRISIIGVLNKKPTLIFAWVIFYKFFLNLMHFFLQKGFY